MNANDLTKDQDFPELAIEGTGTRGVPGINKPEIADPNRPARPDKDPNPLDEAEGPGAGDLDDDDDEFEGDEEDEAGEEDVDESAEEG